MLDLAFLVRLDFLAHLQALEERRVASPENRFVPVEVAKPHAKGAHNQQPAKQRRDVAGR